MDAARDAAGGRASDGAAGSAGQGFRDAEPDASSPAPDGGIHRPSVAADAGNEDAGNGNTVSQPDATSAIAVWTCTGNYEFRSTSITFTEPTPPRLASALTATSNGVNSLSLVLHAKSDGLFGALSATTSSNDIDSFSSSEVPPFAPALSAFGAPPGVTTADAQTTAFLHLRDDSGPVTIQMDHVVWRAGEDSDCSHLTISFQAVIPTSQLSVLLHLPEGNRSVGDLVTPPDAGPVIPIGNPIFDASTMTMPVELRGEFRGTPATFDFNTL